ncbi:MAG: PAS domain S-box protein [Spirochaetales bacterium]|nr:PAS domain S-box protein [Spirochaetales bacterium]
MENKIDILEAEVLKLTQRLQILAREKSHYQMASEILTNIAQKQGLEETARQAVFTIMNALGGSNVILYYKTEKSWYSCDIYSDPQEIPGVVDWEVLAVLKKGKFLEFEGKENSDECIFGAEGTPLKSWLYPLRVAEQIFGAVKMEGVFFEYAEDIQGELKIIIKYLSLSLLNEINASGKLFSAFEALKEESRKLKVEMDERLREEKRYRKTIESSFDGFWIVDTTGKFLEVNEAYCRMIGYTKNELLSMSIMDVEASESPEDTKNRLTRIERIERDRFETKHRHKDGTILDVECNTTYSEGRPNVFYVFIRDITERNKAEIEKERLQRQLQQSQKMEAVGTLAGGIAHDFNNLLFPLMGYAELLKEDIPSGSEQAKMVEQILVAAERSKELIKQILSFSRHNDEELKTVKLQDIIRETMVLLSSSIPKSIEISVDIEETCPPVLANPVQINQVIINLVTNAYHAAGDAQGKIYLSLSEVEIPYNFQGSDEASPGHYTLLKVADKGVGIKKEDMEKIFDPYYTTKVRGKGTGLGLAVVQGIIKNHGGSISLFSQQGKGTEFHIFLPVAGSVEAEGPNEIQLTATGGHERILVVDDEEYIVEMEKMILERLGYDVVSVVGANKAIEAFNTSPESFDLLITDMTMPDYTGIQLAEKIRAKKPDLPVVICTGFSEQINRENKHEFGIDMVLQKPVEKKELANAVRSLLDESPLM